MCIFYIFIYLFVYLFCWVWQNSFDSTPGKCNLKENWKGCKNGGENKKAGVTFSCPQGKNWSIYLALLPSFFPSFPRCPALFVLSALNSALPALFLVPDQTDPPSLLLSFFFTHLSSPRLCSQLTFATRRCCCARTEERATWTRSASVLQSSKGSCANSPAVKRARTATAPHRRASPRPPCCSAL